MSPATKAHPLGAARRARGGRPTIWLAARVLGALSLLAVGAIHLQQYFELYSDIPTIGTLFVLNFIGATIVGVGLLAPIERLLGRLGGVALALMTLAGIAQAATAFVFLYISERTPLFGFMEPGYDPEAILAARIAEGATVVLLGAFMVARFLRRLRTSAEDSRRDRRAGRAGDQRTRGRERAGGRAAAAATVMSDMPLVPGPIYGVRTWGVAGPPGDERLTGPHRTTTWPSGGAMLEAECSAAPPHAPPGTTCACGLHAWHPSRAAARRVCAVRSEVPGILEASGAVEVHADGFRAERGRPHALVLLPNGNPRRLERLAKAYDVELLRLDGPDALLVHCRDRGLGLAEGVVAELVGAEKLAAGRRERRRRGLLTAACAALVVLVLAGIAVAVDPGVEHGKVLNGRSGEIRVP